MNEITYDVFISHASEDKEAIVFPLADQLKALGVRVWYDEFELTVGDSLSRSIDHGLAKSSFGIVVISPDFLRKGWPDYELRGLISKEIGGNKVILPIWHNVSREDIIQHSPTLADKFALSTTGMGHSTLIRNLVKVIRPDIHQQFIRTVLARANTLKSLKNIPLKLLHASEARVPTLTQSLVARAIVVHAMTEDILPMSLAETMYNFRCDVDPEREIRVWERISACYYIATIGESFSLDKKKDIFAVLLAASLGPVQPQELENRQTLSAEEFESLITLFDSDLSSLQVIAPCSSSKPHPFCGSV